jgi:hypothetical protein
LIRVRIPAGALILTDILGRDVPSKIQELAVKKPFLGRILVRLQIHKVENDKFQDFLKTNIEDDLSIARELKKSYPSEIDLMLPSAQSDYLVKHYFETKQKYVNAYCPNPDFPYINKANKHAYFFLRLEIDKAFGIDLPYNLNDVL